MLEVIYVMISIVRPFVFASSEKVGVRSGLEMGLLATWKGGISG